MKLPGPDHPITITPASGRVVVRFGGEVIADTTHALELREASYPAVLYIPRGDARIIVAGDSLFLGNHYIQGGSSGANRDFLNSALNWLVDRPQLVDGIGPRPVTEFRLMLTQKQQQQLRWLLLGALPGGVLVLGWLVWLVRRK